MNCEQLQKQIEGYFEGHASDSVARQIEAHLESCTACQSLSILDDVTLEVASGDFVAQAAVIMLN